MECYQNKVLAQSIHGCSLLGIVRPVHHSGLPQKGLDTYTSLLIGDLAIPLFFIGQSSGLASKVISGLATTD